MTVSKFVEENKFLFTRQHDSLSAFQTGSNIVTHSICVLAMWDKHTLCEIGLPQYRRPATGPDLHASVCEKRF